MAIVIESVSWDSRIGERLISRYANVRVTDILQSVKVHWRNENRGNFTQDNAMLEKGSQLDLSSEYVSSGRTDPNATKPFLGVNFACCGVYSRVYPNAERTAYVGHCPRCARQVRFEIGPGGSDSRFFTAQ